METLVKRIATIALTMVAIVAGLLVGAAPAYASAPAASSAVASAAANDDEVSAQAFHIAAFTTLGECRFERTQFVRYYRILTDCYSLGAAWAFNYEDR